MCDKFDIDVAQYIVNFIKNETVFQDAPIEVNSTSMGTVYIGSGIEPQDFYKLCTLALMKYCAKDIKFPISKEKYLDLQAQFENVMPSKLLEKTINGYTFYSYYS